MESILHQLGSGEGLPVDAIHAADSNRSAMVPLFLKAIAQSASVSPPMRDALFFAFHLLGQWREKAAYRPLAAFLRRPPEEVETILGDAITATSHRVMASVFDGDPDPIYEVIRDAEADEFVRARMCDALVISTLRGELPREEAARFLLSCYSDLQPQDECFVWEGWQGAIAILGLSDLEPLVRDAFERGFISPSWLRYEDFKHDLRRAVDGEEQLWHRTNDYELFGDTIEELQDWDAFAPKREKERKTDSGGDTLARLPIVNPRRAVGRNDPCPCGSGKKFKKCCLNSARSGQSASVLHRTDPMLEWMPGIESAIGQTIETVRKYDPLREPAPEQWLSMDEQQRVDLVSAYHRRAGIGAPNETVHAIIHVIVENQIADAELPVRRTAQRLMSEGLDRHDAIHAIGSVLAGHINDLMRKTDSQGDADEPKSGRDPNEAYFSELEGLTAEGWLRSA